MLGTLGAQLAEPAFSPHIVTRGLAGIGGGIEDVEHKEADKSPPGKLYNRGFLGYGMEKIGAYVTNDPKQNASKPIIIVKESRKYEVDHLVAQGGMGSVYAAKDLKCDRTVAMKRLLTERQLQRESIDRFIAEAQITSKLEHPNIVPVHELNSDAEGHIFYTMKLVKGVSLATVLHDIRKGKQETIDQFPLARLLTIFQKICDAVAFAHSHGIIHRDLKPANTMIGDFGEVLVLDWGLATTCPDRPPQETVASPGPAGPVVNEPFAPTDAGSNEENLKTLVGAFKASNLETDTGFTGEKVVGTPNFIAPEYISGKGDGYSNLSDIYSLGGILYCILTLYPPVRGPDLHEIARKICAGDIAPPADCNRQDETDADAGKKRLFPHCPGGMIPPALSDIAMKALALDPRQRYPSVKELQNDIEAFQNGLIWNLIVDEDFSDPDILSRWEISGGRYEVKNNELRLYDGKPQILLFKTELPGDVRIEFECSQKSAYLNTIGCFLGATRSASRTEIAASGYTLEYGAYDNSLNIVTRAYQILWSKPASPLVKGERYCVLAERVGNRLRLVVNDEEIVSVTDPDPLSGPDRTAVGLVGWIADTCFSRIRIHSLGTPWKRDILDIAESMMQKGRYQTACDLFEEVIQSSPDPARLKRARHGCEAARQREMMTGRLAEWQEQLRKAWPEAHFEIRVENDGLTVELGHGAVADLSPLKGLPVTNLYCAFNRIQSLEPLRGMKLLTLDCSGNPIADLDPLRGMPLLKLVCECCRIPSLEPLKGLPLVVLNCGGNSGLDGNLSPLRGMRLTFLSCWGCNVTDLSPLRGIPLTALFCASNRIADLEPLKGLPLSTLHCSGNRIASLEPLRGMKLNALHMSNNEVSQLEPLQGMALTLCSCDSNRIKNLNPLIGMPIGALVCGNNLLTTVQMFVKKPPDSFHFDCDTIPTDELEWICNAWSRDFRLSFHARNAAVLIALRKEDREGLRKLASERQGHRYLFIPKFLQWAEAEAFCRQLGGHLVTISSKEENDFVSGMFPGGSWFWMGLHTTDKGHEWVTGEPFAYSNFIDPIAESKPGPKIYSGKWACDHDANARNCFVIEWDE